MTGINNDLTAAWSDLSAGTITGAEAENLASSVAKVLGVNIPDSQLKVIGSVLSEVPTLKGPAISGSTLSILSMDEESVMQMLGMENTQAMKNNGIANIKAKHAMRAQQNQKIIDNMSEQIEKMKNQSFWDKLCKAFKIIAGVVGIAAGVVGAVFSGGSSLAITAVVLGTLMSAETIVSAATDGKVGLGAACTKMFGEKAGPWVAMGITVALTVVTLGTGIAGSVKVAEKSAEAVSKAATIAKLATQISQACAQFGGAAAGVGSTLNRYSLEMSKADQKELEALMNKLRAAIELETKFLEEVMEKEKNMITSVKNVVDSCTAATTAIATGQA